MKFDFKRSRPRHPSEWLRLMLALGGLGLVVAAVVSELRRPRAERTWEGKVGGVVPYYLRPPTVQRVRSTYWNPESPRILQPKAFGVGWDVNFAAVARRGRPPVTSRDVDPAREADIREVIEETLRDNPGATEQDVLAAWKVRRGVTIDDAEAARVQGIFASAPGPVATGPNTGEGVAQAG